MQFNYCGLFPAEMPGQVVPIVVFFSLQGPWHASEDARKLSYVRLLIVAAGLCREVGNQEGAIKTLRCGGFAWGTLCRFNSVEAHGTRLKTRAS